VSPEGLEVVILLALSVSGETWPTITWGVQAAVVLLLQIWAQLNNRGH